MQQQKYHILLIDDDQEILDLLQEFLERQNFAVTTRASGADLWSIMETQGADLVILDIMLPGTDGLTLCRELRQNNTVPIILLTALDEETDRIVGLEVGADDYLVKPFSPRELLARMRAIFRRTRAAAGPEPARTPQSFTFSNCSFNPKKRELRSQEGILVHLSRSEFDLLLAFVMRPHHALDRDELSEIVRGHALEAFDRSIDLHVSRLRSKLEPIVKQKDIIKTVRGVGYMFAIDVETVL